MIKNMICYYVNIMQLHALCNYAVVNSAFSGKQENERTLYNFEIWCLKYEVYGNGTALNKFHENL